MVKTVDGSVLEKLVEFHSTDRDFPSDRHVPVRSGSGDKDFLSGHVSGSGVMLGVRDPP